MDEKNWNDQEPAEDGVRPEASGQVPPMDQATEILPDSDALASVGKDMNEAASSGRQLHETREQFRDEEYLEAFGEGDDLRRMFEDSAPTDQEDAPGQEPEQIPDTPEQSREVLTEAEEISMRKGRPRHKKGYGLLGIPHMIATVIWLVVIVAIGVSMGRVIWVCAADVLAFGREEKLVEVRIDNADTLDDISVKLKDAGLIRYPVLFKLYAAVTDAREDISSGTYVLNTLYDYHALVGSLNYYSYDSEEVTVMIPEGYTCAQIFQLMEEKGVCSAEELEDYAKDGELDGYWFLAGVERGDKYCLEGFLFPDTYEFYENSSAKRVLTKLLDNFEYRFTEEMQASVATLNDRLTEMMRSNGYDDAFIAEHEMSLRDVVTVASLVEKETAGNEESFDIASVIYNRLTNQAEWPWLNIDAALLYAIGHRDVISAADLEIDTPYNTYKYKGLIPGPIANPGLNSLKAALNPNDTSYHCYALDPSTEQHHFSETLDEHNAFLAGLEG